MRGPDIQQDALFSTVSPDARVPKDHPLRPIRVMVDTALKELDAISMPCTRISAGIRSRRRSCCGHSC